MKRRPFVAAIAGLVVTAGCTTRGSGLAGDTTPTATPDSRERTNTPSSECPSFVRDADRTVCSDDSGDAEVYIDPSEERFVDYGADETVQTIRFTLRNESDRPFSIDVNDWAVKHRTDSGWQHVAPDDHTDERVEVPSGGSYEWTLATQTHPSPMAADSQSIVVDLRSAETYAFAVHGSLGDEHIECVTRFEYVLAVPNE